MVIIACGDLIECLNLCQVCKLIEDSEKSKSTKVNMSQDAITEWLLQNKVLSIAFESKFLLI